MLNSYLELNFDVLHAASGNRYVDGDDIRLVNLGVIGIFSIYKLTTSSVEHLENIDHAHIVCLIYKLLASSRDSDDLPICFDQSRDRRKRQLTNKKTQKGKFHQIIYLKEVFLFAEHLEIATHGLGY